MSTRTTPSPAPRRLGDGHPVAPHRGQVALPQSRSGKVEDASSPDPADEFLEGPLDGPGVGALATQPQGLLQEIFVEYKTHTFHAHVDHRRTDGTSATEFRSTIRHARSGVWRYTYQRPIMPQRLWIRCLLLTLAVPAVAQTTGLVPLNDLGTGFYQGNQGGLYPGGANTPPAGHQTAAMQRASQIVPRDAAGIPSPDGFIAFIAVGMSNTTHEFAVFEREEDRNPDRNARVVLMDTALGGQTAAAISNPAASYWTVVQQRLTSMGLSAAQVQVAWLKEADANPPDNFPVHAQTLRDELEVVAQNLHDKFPNLRLCYVSSRTYGGYAAPGTLNPEPQGYESGFAVKWLIEDQIDGDPGLNHDPSAGPIRAPLLLWGPYLWADGTSPRSDGLTWLLTDFENDHTHPSPAGEEKVAGLLSSFFASEPTAAPWWPAQPDATLVTVTARGDAYVRASAPGSNFGANPQLLAQGGASPTNTYLTFDQGLLGRPAALAKLSLRVVQDAGGRVSLVNDTTWSEGSLTYASAPPIGAPLVELPQSSRDGTIAAAVTQAVNADPDGVVSFALTIALSAQASYHSEEAGQPPRLVLVVPTACAGSADYDGDLHSDGCDCAPANPTLFAVPREIRNLRFLDRATLAWASDAQGSGSATRYDVMAGDLADVDFLGTGPNDACIANDLAATQVPDPTPTPGARRGLFFLVRGDNACGKGRYETTSAGEDRLTTVCP